MSLAVKTFFASKETRRRLDAIRQLDAGSSTERILNLRNDLFDQEWYAAQHGRDAARAARETFLNEGPIGYLAPRAELAGPDGRHLSQWGAEFLVRLGLPVGTPGTEALNPGDSSALRPFGIRNSRNKRVAVVTAIFGGFDRLHPVDPAWSETADFYVFTDRHLPEVAGWQLVHANYANVDPRRRARFVKTHLPTYFADYDWAIWVDGNVFQCVDPVVLVDKHEQGEPADFYAYRHVDRSNIIAEAAACSSLGKESVSTVVGQLQRTAGLPGFASPVLFATMVMLMRPGSPAVRDMCKTWWRHIMRGSKRDQLSLPLAVAETTDLRWAYFHDGWLHRSPYLVWTSHR